MTTQLFHNIKRLLRTVKSKVNENALLLQPETVISLEVSEEENTRTWNLFTEDQKNQVITWWEQLWGETLDDSHQNYRVITEKQFLKFFTVDNLAFIKN